MTAGSPYTGVEQAEHDPQPQQTGRGVGDRADGKGCSACGGLVTGGAVGHWRMVVGLVSGGRVGVVQGKSDLTGCVSLYSARYSLARYTPRLEHHNVHALRA